VVGEITAMYGKVSSHIQCGLCRGTTKVSIERVYLLYMVRYHHAPMIIWVAVTEQKMYNIKVFTRIIQNWCHCS